MASYEKYETRRRVPDPKSAVLLVIDVQNHFSGVASPILPSLLSTIRLCRRASIPVIFTRHSHKSQTDPNNMLSEWWPGDLIVDNTPAADLMPQLDRDRDPDRDIVVEKSTYSAFQGTGLEERLAGMGAREVIVAGVMTNLCCETTALDAFVRGFWVFFSTDATATADQELHEAAIKNLAYGFAYLVDSARLRQGLFGFGD